MWWPGIVRSWEGSVPVPARPRRMAQTVKSFSTFAICEQNNTAKAAPASFWTKIRIGTKLGGRDATSPPSAREPQFEPQRSNSVARGMATFSSAVAGVQASVSVAGQHGCITWTPATAPPGFSTNAHFLCPVGDDEFERQQIPLSGKCCLRQRARLQHDGGHANRGGAGRDAAGRRGDDFFMKRDRLSGPVNSTNSQWFTDTTASLL